MFIDIIVYLIQIGLFGPERGFMRKGNMSKEYYTFSTSRTNIHYQILYNNDSYGNSLKMLCTSLSIHDLDKRSNVCVN